MKSILQLWNAYADLFNSVCDPWTDDSDAYWGGSRFHEQSRDISLIYFVQISDSGTENLGEISSVLGIPTVGRGGQIKRILDGMSGSGPWRDLSATFGL